MEQLEAFVNETSDSPHFGDEQSLRGAQPVVALAEIRSNKLRNGLLLTLALLFAVGLGATVALFLVQLKQPANMQSTTKTEATVTTKSDDSAVAIGSEEEEMVDLTGKEETNAEDQTSEKTTRKKRVARVQNSASEDTGNTTPLTTATDNDATKKPVLVDQWEERRSRRVKPNDRPQANVRRPDLFRIRDIFEGARP